MAKGVTFKVNKSEFTRTLAAYRTVSKRSNKEICDTKAYFISIRASAETYRTPKEVIEHELNVEIRKVRRRNPKSGRMKNYKQSFVQDATAAPMAALIVNARLGRKGKHGLFGAAMEEAVRRLFTVRNMSRAFLASCWLPAINALRFLAVRRGAPRQDRAPRAIGGGVKGYAQPAVEGWVCKTVFANLAETKRDHKAALIKYGAPALQAAFDAETASMKDYILNKQREDAKAAGIKTRG